MGKIHVFVNAKKGMDCHQRQAADLLFLCACDRSTEQEHDGIPQRFVGFGRKMAELDETIERHAAHLAADIKLEMRGLTAAEQSSLSCMLRRALENGQFAARVPGHELLPLRSGCVTIGAVAGSADRWVLSESRKHPGFWHDIDLHDGTTSDRPVRPLGMAYRFLRSPHELRWRTANEDGAFASFVDQPRGREVSQP